MNKIDICTVVVEWAKSKGALIKRVWLFGSQARGSEKENSDVDLAVEISIRAAGGGDESGGFATWALVSEGWEKELTDLVGKKVDLEFYAGNATPTLHRAIAQDGKLLYPLQQKR